MNNRLINKYRYYFVSFGISSLVVLFIFLYNHMLLGEYSVVRSDYCESVGLLREFCRNVFTKNNPYFSFSCGLGLNNSFAMACILFSPFNLLYLLLYNVDINIVTAIVIILKLSCATVSFYYFSEKVLKHTGWTSVIVSVFYGTCAYNIAYGTIHIFWLDSVLILPILLVGMYKCINEEKRVLLILAYSYLFITDYYTGYMVGFFSLFVFAIYLIVLYNPKTITKVKEYLKIILNWFLSVVISVMISAFVWAPALFFIAANRVEDSTEIIPIIHSLLQVFNGLFWGIGYGISGAYGYIYCGIPVLLLIIIYFIDRCVDIKEKLFSGIILGVMILCMISTKMNSFMHVFDQPDYFWYRYSFIISFIACAIACRKLNTINLKSFYKIPYIIFGLVIFYSFILHTINLWDLADEGRILNSNKGLIVNIFLLISWSVFAYIYFSKKNQKIVVILSAILLICEIVSNSPFLMVFKDDYLVDRNWADYIEKSVSEIKELNIDNSDIYRMVSLNTMDYNSDMRFGFNGFSDFGNQEKYDVRRFLSNVGFATAPRLTLDNGFNPASEMLLGVKYVLVCPEELYDNEKRVSYKPYYLENPYYLGVGYSVRGDSFAFGFEERNAFNNTNAIIKSLSGIDEDCFIKIPDSDIKYIFNGIDYQVDENGKVVFLKTEESGTCYILVDSTKYNNAFVQFEKNVSASKVNDFYILNANNYSNYDLLSASSSCINEFSYSEESNKLFISLETDEESEGTFECDAINVYYLDYEILQKHYDELSKRVFKITKSKNGYIEGIAEASDDKRLVFFSIPYDPGWKVYLDGTETEAVRLYDGAFMGVFVPKAGTYNIKLEYEVPGLKLGVVVSLLGIVGFLSVLFEKKLKKTRNSSKSK